MLLHAVLTVVSKVFFRLLNLFEKCFFPMKYIIRLLLMESLYLFVPHKPTKVKLNFDTFVDENYGIHNIIGAGLLR